MKSIALTGHASTQAPHPWQAVGSIVNTCSFCWLQLCFMAWIMSANLTGHERTQPSRQFSQEVRTPVRIPSSMPVAHTIAPNWHCARHAPQPMQSPHRITALRPGTTFFMIRNLFPSGSEHNLCCQYLALLLSLHYCCSVAGNRCFRRSQVGKALTGGGGTI